MGRPVLGGLPLVIELSSPIEIVRYLLLTAFFDLLAGIPAAREIPRPNQFSLLRAGWKRWWMCRLGRLLCLNAIVGVLPLVLSCLLFSDLPEDWPPNYLLWSWLLWFPYMLACTALQTLLIGTFQNAQSGLVPMLFCQLSAAILSSELPGNLKLLLIGNWGSYLRTTAVGEPYGVPLPACLALSLLALGSTYFFGWRLVRRRNLTR